MSSVVVSRQHNALVVVDQPQLRQLIPHARQFRWAEQDLLTVPHGVEETRLLRNLNFPAPSPILTDYDWCGTTPFEVQRDTAAMLVTSPRAYVLSEFGTGKTRAMLYAADYLMTKKVIRKALIAAPLSTLNPVWEREIFKHFWRSGRKTAVLWGTKERRIERLEEDVDFYIINHDGLKVMATELAARKDIDLVIVDELASFRNARTDRWRAANSIIGARKYAWGATGAPTPRAPTDAWGQARLLTPERAPRFFSHFQDLTMTKVSMFTFVPRPSAVETIHNMMQPSVRFRLDQVMELPPLTYSNRDVPLEPEQKRVYDALLKEMSTLHANGEITAANEGVLLSKLLQVATGYVYDSKKNIVALPNLGRLKVVEELLEQTSRKAIVFAPFVHAVDGVYDYLTKQGYDCAKVYGETPKGERDETFVRFQNSPLTRVLVAHPQCMAHGLTLTEANLIIWFGPTQDLEHYDQANHRIPRPGQTSPMHIVHLVGAPVERNTYARLRRKQTLQGALLALFDGVDETPDE